MRPVNLIPKEQRRGQHAPLRSGPLAYVLLGALVAVLAGVTVLVMTGNEISEREDEIATLEVEDAAARARAERLAPYTQFRALAEQRVATVASLADSRFDWERVMRELALILPSDAWLVSLTATATPSVSVGGGGGGGGSDLRAATPGPALELSGCADGQEAVAGFVTALKDIEGVTRVGVQSSELNDQAAGGAGGGGDDCRTRDFIAKFDLVVAFDAAPIPAIGTEEAPVAPPAEAEATETSSETTEEGG
ncbi:MAG TPA: PilN domain-containing protein [Solirubrobacterales bacterium]|nr:PilN domain-containing protein [Solirubrobacterales bacterium]